MVGTLAYVAISVSGGGLALFSIASLVLGIGFCFYSGAVEAWLVDALRATGYDGQLDPIFARGSMVSGVAMLIGSVGGGLLGAIDLAWPYVLRAGLLVVVFVVAFRVMHDIGFTPRTTTLSRASRRSAQGAARQPDVRMEPTFAAAADGRSRCSRARS